MIDEITDLRNTLHGTELLINILAKKSKDDEAKYRAQYNEIKYLKRQLEECKSYKDDAERYRWLRDNGCIFWTGVHTDKEVKHQVCEQAMDVVIDKAIKGN